jgi:sugar O-acyltransferase (sialic acid O-acetyltransferase NeuD family)
VNLPIIVIGGGGHGRVVIDALLRAGAAVVGVIDPDRLVATRLPASVPWLGGDDELASYPPSRYRLAIGVGGIGDPQRRRLFETFHRADYGFARVEHPAATIALSGVSLGEGCQIMAGAVIQAGARIGADAIINTRAAIDHDCVVGDHSHVAPGAVLCGDVAVGEDSHIGAGAVVIQGVRIGRGCIIGANATILRDVPDRTIVFTRSERRETPRR